MAGLKGDVGFYLAEGFWNGDEFAISAGEGMFARRNNVMFHLVWVLFLKIVKEAIFSFVDKAVVVLAIDLE